MPAELQRLDTPASPNPDSPQPLTDPLTGPASIRLTWLWASVPSIFLLGLTTIVAGREPLANAPIRASRVPASVTWSENPGAIPASLRNGILPASQTAIVSRRSISGFMTLRGELERAVSVQGHAPLSGEVSKVLVKPGQVVAVNDRVLEISTTSATRASARAQDAQDSAESSQVAAVGQQEALQGKMLAAHERLAAAQKRVDAAQTRLASARLIVQKLQRGETVSSADAKPARAEKHRVSVKAFGPQGLVDAKEKAEADAEKAKRQAEKAAARASSAAHAVTAAESDARLKTQKVDELRIAAAKVQKLFDGGAAKVSDVDAARAGLEDAQADAQAAANQIGVARKEALQQQAAAEEARDAAARAAKSAAQAQQKLQAAPKQGTPEDNTTSEPADASDGDGGASDITVEDAARMVRSAIEESDAAAADARTIKLDVDNYERQVHRTKNRLDSSSENLEAAQQRVLDETIEHNLSIVRAPANGTVLSVAAVADNISSGDVIIQIGRSDVLQVKFTDSSDAWRNLKPDMILTGRAEAREAGAAVSRIPVIARITDIEPPGFRNKHAIITVVVNPRGGIRYNDGTLRLHEGMNLLCSVVKPGGRPTILVPTTAIVPVRPGVGTVAVLTPQDGQNEAAEDEAAPEHRIEWREVQLGIGDGVQQEVTTGLGPGERIALQPTTLRLYAENTGVNKVRVGTNL